MGNDGKRIDLRGVRAKLDRANEHSLELQVAIGSVFDTDQEFFRTEVDSTGLRYKIYSTAIPTVDLRWSVIVGDLLTNLRAALDHLAYQLVILDDGKPHDHKTHFPILESAYNKQGTERLPVINPGIRRPDIQALIEEVQPYKRGEGNSAKQHQLWALNKLVNVDKHRLLLVVKVVLDEGNVYWGSTPEIGSPKVCLTRDPVVSNMHVATFDFPHTSPGPELAPIVSLTARLDEGPQGNRIRTRPLIQLMAEVEYFVNVSVMDRFTPLFPLDTPGHP